MFNHYSLFGPSVFETKQIFPPDRKYPGEVPYTFKQRPSNNIHNARGRSGCIVGKLEWFAEGVPPGLTLVDVDIPSCCGDWEPAPVQPFVVAIGDNYSINLFSVDMTVARTHHHPAYLWGTWSGSGGSPPPVPAGWVPLVYQSLHDGSWWLMVCRRILDGTEPDTLIIPNGDYDFGCGAVNVVEGDHGLAVVKVVSTDGEYQVVPSVWSPDLPALELAMFGTFAGTDDDPPPGMTGHAGGVNGLYRLISGSAIVTERGNTPIYTRDLLVPSAGYVVTLLIRGWSGPAPVYASGSGRVRVRGRGVTRVALGVLGSGVITIAGGASVSVPVYVEGGGVIVIAGVSNYWAQQQSGSGVIVIAGSADSYSSVSELGSGVIVFAGSADSYTGAIESGSGVIVFAGSADIIVM